MKTILCGVVAFTLLAGTSLCQTTDSTETVSITNSLGFVTNVPAAALSAINTPAPVTNTYTPPEIRVDSGGAVADYGLLSLRFTPDVAESRPVTISRKGNTIAFRPTYIAVVKRSTDEAWILGQVTNSILEVSGSEVVYRDAFDTVDGDIRYHYNGNRLEQFIHIRERLELPKELQGCEADLALECWTSFSLENEPVSVQEAPVLLREAQAGLPAVEAGDQSTDLGNLKIPGGGKAFRVGEEEDTIPVSKTWIQMNRPDEPEQQALPPTRFLCERADWISIKPQLDKLPKHPGHASLEKRKSSRALLARLIPSPAPALGTPAPVLVAKSSPPANSGLVIDFAVVAPPGLIAWWKGEGNTSDSKGGFTGTLQGGMGYAAGKVGQALTSTVAMTGSRWTNRRQRA